METLSKLNINAEAIMKDVELFALRGGALCPPEEPFPCFCTESGQTYFAGCQGSSSACDTRCA